MPISKDAVQHVAHLARIECSAKELDRLAQQLKGILDFIDKLKQVDVSDIKPTSHILPINNVFREDSPGDSLPVDKVLDNAPQKIDNFFGVPKIIE